MTYRTVTGAVMAAAIIAAMDREIEVEAEEPPISRQQRRALERASISLTLRGPEGAHDRWPEKGHERRNSYPSNPKRRAK